MKPIMHGIPTHNCFGIFQPCFSRGGLDCASIAMGIGLTHQLENPHTHVQCNATLLQRRTLYTDDQLFGAIAFMVYGLSSEEVLELMRKRYPDMEESLVELWIFKKE